MLLGWRIGWGYYPDMRYYPDMEVCEDSQQEAQGRFAPQSPLASVLHVAEERAEGDRTEVFGSRALSQSPKKRAEVDAGGLARDIPTTTQLDAGPGAHEGKDAERHDGRVGDGPVVSSNSVSLCRVLEMYVLIFKVMLLPACVAVGSVLWFRDASIQSRFGKARIEACSVPESGGFIFNPTANDNTTAMEFLSREDVVWDPPGSRGSATLNRYLSP